MREFFFLLNLNEIKFFFICLINVAQDSLGEPVKICVKHFQNCRKEITAYQEAKHEKYKSK